MKRQLKILGIVIGVLLALGIVFVAVQSIERKIDEVEEMKGESFLLWNLDQNDVVSIEVVRETNPYQIIWSDSEGFVVEGYEGLSKNAHMYEHALGILQLETVRSIGNENDLDLADFGLENAQFKIEITMKNGDTNTISLGNLSSDGTQIYLLKDDEVFIARADTFSDLLQSPTAFLSTNIAPYSSNPSSIDVKRVIYKTSTGGNIVVEKTEIDNSINYSTGYSVIAPIEREIRSEKVSEFTQSAQVLQGEAIKAYPTDEELENYGLNSPFAKMEVQFSFLNDSLPIDDPSLEQGSYIIQLGHYNPEDRTYYAQLEGENIVYKVLEEAVPWNDYTVYSLINLYFLNIPKAEIQSIEINTGNENYQFNIQTIDGVQKATIGAIEIPDESFLLYYELLLRGSGKAFIEPKDYENMVATFTFSTITGEVLKWDIYSDESNPNDLIIRISDPMMQMDMTVSRNYIDKILSSTRILSNGGTINSIEW